MSRGGLRIGTSPNTAAMFEYQDPATLNQANPAQNSWYWILGTGTTAGVLTAGVDFARVYLPNTYQI